MLFLSIDVKAAEVNVTNKIKSMSGFIGGTYGADDINDGYNSIYGNFNVNTRYYGRLGYLQFYLSADDYSFAKDHTYTITLNMATNDWRNNFMGPQVLKCNSDGSLQTTNYSLSVSNFRFVSRKQIKFNFKTNGTLSPYYKFVLYSNNYASQGGTAITGDSNWNLSSIFINDNVSSSSSSSSGGSSSSSNQEIIDGVGQSVLNGALTIFENANNNTTDTILNNNNNTQDIINNQNNNTNTITNIIDNVNQQLGSCYTNLLNQNDNFVVNGGTYSHNGDTIILNSSNGWSSAYIDIPLKKAGSYTVSIDNNLESGGYINVYYVNPNGDRGDWLGGFSSGSQSSSFTTNKTNGYFRVILGDNKNTSGSYTFWKLRLTNTSSKVAWVQYNNSVCTSKLDDTTNAIEEQTEVSRGILGKIGDIFNSIINLPIKIAEKLLDMLKSLFIPDSEEFEDLINDFKDTISQKLGVIYQAGDLIINIFTSIINDDSPENACLTFPNVSLPDGTNIIQEQQFCFNSVTDNFPILLTLIRSLSGIFITITFINMLKKKYDDFINGGQL